MVLNRGAAVTVSQVNTFTVLFIKRAPHVQDGLGQGALLLARAVLAAAALPLLGAAVRHAACARGRRADVLAAVQRVTYGVAAAAATYFIMLITCAPVAAVGQLRDAPTHVQRSNALHVWMSNHAFPPSCCTWSSAAL